MLTQTQIERLAAMAHSLRPDWPLRSVQTHITNHHTYRAYRDLAIALAYVAADSESSTPARLTSPGPWWRAGLVGEETPTPAGKCQVCHGYHNRLPCPGPNRIGDHRTGIADVRAEYEATRARLCPHGVPWRACHQHDGHVVAGEVVNEEAS